MWSDKAKCGVFTKCTRVVPVRPSGDELRTKYTKIIFNNRKIMHKQVFKDILRLKKPVYGFFLKLTVSDVYTSSDQYFSLYQINEYRINDLTNDTATITDLVNQPFVIIVNNTYYTLYTVGANMTNMLTRPFPPSG